MFFTSVMSQPCHDTNLNNVWNVLNKLFKSPEEWNWNETRMCNVTYSVFLENDKIMNVFSVLPIKFCQYSLAFVHYGPSFHVINYKICCKSKRGFKPLDFCLKNSLRDSRMNE